MPKIPISHEPYPGGAFIPDGPVPEITPRFTELRIAKAAHGGFVVTSAYPHEHADMVLFAGELGPALKFVGEVLGPPPQWVEHKAFFEAAAPDEESAYISKLIAGMGPRVTADISELIETAKATLPPEHPLHDFALPEVDREALIRSLEVQAECAPGHGLLGINNRQATIILEALRDQAQFRMAERLDQAVADMDAAIVPKSQWVAPPPPEPETREQLVALLEVVDRERGVFAIHGRWAPVLLEALRGQPETPKEVAISVLGHHHGGWVKPSGERLYTQDELDLEVMNIRRQGLSLEDVLDSAAAIEFPVGVQVLGPERAIAWTGDLARDGAFHGQPLWGHDPFRLPVQLWECREKDPIDAAAKFLREEVSRAKVLKRGEIG